MNHEPLSPSSLAQLAAPILILGPAHSGKSQLALQLLDRQQPAMIIGTADDRDPLMAARITALQARWAPDWSGREVSREQDLDALLADIPPSTPQLLIDSVNQWLAYRLVHDFQRYTTQQLHQRAHHDLGLLVAAIRQLATQRRVILVSSELGSSPPPSQPLPLILREAVGIANQRLADMSPTVIMQVAGIPQVIKGG